MKCQSLAEQIRYKSIYCADLASLDRRPEYVSVQPVIVAELKFRDECGMKFEYGIHYGYCCMNPRCPIGLNYR